MTKFAVFTDDAIFGIGESPEAAVANAKEWGFDSAEIVPHDSYNSYHGGIVDLISAHRLTGDGEAVSGASGKLRRITDRLAAQVEEFGGDIRFDTRPDGWLDIPEWDEE